MSLARSWYETQGTTIRAATDRLNKALGTRYGQERVGQWIGEKRHMPDHVRLFMLRDSFQIIAEELGVELSDEQANALIEKIK